MQAGLAHWIEGKTEEPVAEVLPTGLYIRVEMHVGRR